MGKLGKSIDKSVSKVYSEINLYDMLYDKDWMEERCPQRE